MVCFNHSRRLSTCSQQHESRDRDKRARSRDASSKATNRERLASRTLRSLSREPGHHTRCGWCVPSDDHQGHTSTMPTRTARSAMIPNLMRFLLCSRPSRATSRTARATNASAGEGDSRTFLRSFASCCRSPEVRWPMVSSKKTGSRHGRFLSENYSDLIVPHCTPSTTER